MKTTFLFGAGADSVYGICKGISFIEPLLCGQYEKERKSLLGDTKGSYQLLYPQSKKIYLQTIASHPNKAENALGKEFTNRCIQYYNKECTGTTELEMQEILNRCTRDWYNMLKSKCFDQDHCNEDVYEFFLNNAVFFDSLDEKMNDLRNTPLNTNGKRIVNAYVTIFIMMMQEIYDLNDFVWNYGNIFSTLRSKDKRIDIDTKSYYRILKELLSGDQQDEHRWDEIHFVTTNYTDIAEKVLGRNITYLHGRLNWFEDHQHLMVYDCLNDNEYQEVLKHADTLVPFILIPSGIKPIICKKQIQEFHKFINDLDDSDVLYVLGYKFNSEDNHINSIIAEWLRKPNKKLLYFNYKKEFDFAEAKWAEDFAGTIAISTWRNFENASVDTVREFLNSSQKILNIVIGENGADIDFTIFQKAIEPVLF